MIISLVLVTDIKAWHLKLTGKIKAMIAGGRQAEVRNGGDEGGFILLLFTPLHFILRILLTIDLTPLFSLTI